MITRADPQERFAHHLGSYVSVFGADNALALDGWQLRLRHGEAGFGITPVRDNTELRIAFGFEFAPLPDDLREVHDPAGFERDCSPHPRG